MSNSFYGASVSSTFQRLVQIVDGLYYDGLGNLLNIGGSGSNGIGPTGPQGATGAAGVSLMWMGSWTQSMYYVSYDAVNYNGSSYICLTNNPQHAPGISPSEWDILAQGGQNGSGTGSIVYFIETGEYWGDATFSQAVNWNLHPDGSANFGNFIINPDGSAQSNGEYVVLSVNGITANSNGNINIPGGFGATGPQGPTGADGVNGATGPQGSTGADGVNGTTGSQGIQGEIGATGSQGIQGIQGPTGSTGPTGSQGIQGPTGSTGVLYTTNPLYLNGSTLSIYQSTSTQSGYLSYTDWNIFNNKQNQLNGSGFLVINGITVSYLTGSSNQFIKADGSLDNSSYLTSSSLIPYALTATLSNYQQKLNGTGIVYSSSASISYINGYPQQYVRGDGTLGDFPTSAGGGGGSIYYFNNGITESNIGGIIYSQISKIPNQGTASNINTTQNGTFSYFLTDALQPGQSNIPAGVWTFQIYFSTTSTSVPNVIVTIYKYDGTTFSYITTSQGENIDTGSTIDLHYFSLSMPQTSLSLTDRLVTVFSVSNLTAGNLTMYTQGNNLSNVNTTFPVGIATLNGLNIADQFFTVGSNGVDFNIISSTQTHTFNIPSSSSSNRGLLTSTDWTIFNNKQNKLNGSGFIVANGITVSYLTGSINQFIKADGSLDNSSYLTASSLVPYALTATLSNYLTTISASSIYQTIIINPLTGTGINGYIPVFNGTSSLNTSNIYTAGTNIIIGAGSVDNSSGILQTAGNVVPTTNNNYTLGTNTYQWTNIYSQLGTFGATLSTNGVYVSGNVGIGTTAPTQALTLASGKQMVIFNTADQTTNYQRFKFLYGTNVQGQTTFYSVGENGGSANNVSALFGTRNGSNSIIFHYTLVGGTSATTNTSVINLSPGGASWIPALYSGTTYKPIILFNGSISGASGSAGNHQYLQIAPTVNINTGSLVGSSIVRVSPYIQSLGSASNYLLDLGTNNAVDGMGTHSSVFNVDTLGNVNGLYVGIGPGASTSNTNTVLGFTAFGTNVTGTNNVAIGYQSLQKANTSFNTAVGAQALQLMTGGFNVAVGYACLLNATNGRNTAVGAQAGQQNTGGQQNTIIGNQALQSNTSGSANVAIGYNSGFAISGGTISNTVINNSVIIGSSAYPLANNDTNEIIIGYSAVGNGSNTITIGNISSTTTYLPPNLSLGLTSSGATISSPVGQSIFFNTSGGVLINAVNNQNLQLGAAGSGYVWITAANGLICNNIIAPNTQLQVGSGAGQRLVFASNGTEQMRLTASGSVLIGTQSDNGNKLQVVGSASITSNLIFTSTASSPYIKFNNLLTGTPSYNTYSNGAKIILADTISSSSTGYVIGLDQGLMWFSSDLAGNGFQWYAGTRSLATLIGSTGLTLNNIGSNTNASLNITGITQSVNSAIYISGNNTVGGNNYIDFLKVNNTVSGATTPTKTFRLNNLGSIEILNNAYTNVIFSVTDTGIGNFGGGLTIGGSLTSNDRKSLPYNSAAGTLLAMDNLNTKLDTDGYLYLSPVSGSFTWYGPTVYTVFGSGISQYSQTGQSITAGTWYKVPVGNSLAQPGDMVVCNIATSSGNSYRVTAIKTSSSPFYVGLTIERLY